MLNVPVIHGSFAVPLGQRATDTRSHEWWIYLRPEGNIDISHFIKHVEFCLHDSFDPAVRKVTSPPYEVHESGWGEFDAIIKVYFQDSVEKMVEFFHPLRLFHGDTEIPESEPVVTEYYDEIVFQDPSEKLLSLLKSTPRDYVPPTTRYSAHFNDFTHAETIDLKKIEDARRRVREETLKRQERYEKLEKERAALLREIASRGGNE